MCRLWLADRKAFQWIASSDEPDMLTEWLEQLEKSFGGHGNGCAVLMADGSIERVRGLYLWSWHAAQWLRDEYEAGATHFLFHTRLASMGSRTVENCHPFLIDQTCLAHNGHDSLLIDVAKKHGYQEPIGGTDSQAATFLANMFGPSFLRYCSGNFVGFYNTEPFAIVGYDSWYELYEINTGNGGKIYSSELPEKIDKSCYTFVDLNPSAISWKKYVHVSTDSKVDTTVGIDGYWDDNGAYHTVTRGKETSKKRRERRKRSRERRRIEAYEKQHLLDTVIREKC